jgi:DmsE family decaheme c-type cytochrome
MLLRVCVWSMALWLLGFADLAWASDEEPAFSRRGADGCIGCHGDWDPPLMGLFQNPHGNPHDSRSPFGERQLQCEACHGPGAAHGGRVPRGQPRPPIINFGSEAWTPIPQQNAMCLQCHEGHVGEQWAGSVHDLNSVACADCHSSHKPADPMLTRHLQGEACYACHSNVKAHFLKPYAHPVRQGQVVCTDCHNPHGTSNQGLLVRSNLNETCYSCHTEKRGPLLWEHAPVPEDCTICHDPHGAVGGGGFWGGGATGSATMGTAPCMPAC